MTPDEKKAKARVVMERLRATDPAYRARQQEATKGWRAAHPEYGKEYMKRYRERHPEYIRKYRETHAEELKQKSRAYYRSHQKEQQRKSRERRVRNPELHRERVWESKVRSYGLTLDQYHALFERQGERCAVCQVVILPMGRGTHIDHDHTTERVRGLLCNECNLGLGQFKDRPDVLRAAATYLERHHA